jgi:hypothetical protein
MEQKYFTLNKIINSKKYINIRSWNMDNKMETQTQIISYRKGLSKVISKDIMND